jgi:hypothetical protein
LPPVTVPAVLLPSPQSIIAVKCSAGLLALLSLNVATVPVKVPPWTALILLPVPLKVSASVTLAVPAALVLAVPPSLSWTKKERGKAPSSA